MKASQNIIWMPYSMDDSYVGINFVEIKSCFGIAFDNVETLGSIKLREFRVVGFLRVRVCVLEGPKQSEH